MMDESGTFNVSSRFPDFNVSSRVPDSAVFPESGWNVPVALPEEMEGFKLCWPLGRGSAGTVYQAEQIRQFAVKVIPWQSGDGRERARHEFELGKLFQLCPEILQSTDYYEKDQNSFIVMEYGTPCLRWFANGNSTMHDVLDTVLNISRALEEIHAQGYTHSDVKPDNIIMVKGKAKLADFSHCSKLIPGQTYDRSMGSGVYIAPEVRPGGTYTGREDLYSLGITMYVLLMAGRKPFDFSDRDTHRRESGDRIESLFIHPELLAIIQRAAAYDADDRYPDIQTFSGEIRAFMDRHEGALDEEMPLYRMIPSLQQTEPPYLFGGGSGPILDWDKTLEES